MTLLNIAGLYRWSNHLLYLLGLSSEIHLSDCTSNTRVQQIQVDLVKLATVKVSAESAFLNNTWDFL